MIWISRHLSLAPRNAVLRPASGSITHVGTVRCTTVGTGKAWIWISRRDFVSVGQWDTKANIKVIS